MSLLTWSEKEKMVIELQKQGISPKEIARQLHMSLRDVYKILKKEFGEKERELTTELQAIKLYKQKKYPVEVSLKLRIPPEEAIRYYIKYKDMIYLGKIGENYKVMKGKLKEISLICDAMRREETI